MASKIMKPIVKKGRKIENITRKADGGKIKIGLTTEEAMNRESGEREFTLLHVNEINPAISIKGQCTQFINA